MRILITGRGAPGIGVHVRHRSAAMRRWVLPLMGLLTAACQPRQAGVPELRIVAYDYGFQMPSHVPAGLVRITLHNEGHDLHEATFARFTSDRGTAALYRDSIHAGVAFPAFAEDAGGAMLTMPGDSGSVWLRLTPGHYVVACWKGDHLSRGMVRDLVVDPPDSARRVPPAPSGEIVLTDFAYTINDTLQAGEQVLHVMNRGREEHEADLIRLSSPTALADYIAWMDNHQVGMPPANPVGGVGDLLPGAEAWMRVRLEPGRYALLCQVPSASHDGRAHYQLGMVREFVVAGPAPAGTSSGRR